MKHLNWIFMLSMMLLTFTACDDDDDEYTGNNELFLLADGEKTLVESEDKVIDITVQLTHTAKEDVQITFEFENKTTTDANVLAFETNPVTIVAGEKTAKLKVKSQNKGVVTQNNTLAVKMTSATDEKIILNAPLELTVTPDPQFTPLTEEQLALIKGYQDNGLDLMPWIGVIPVEVKINYPGGGYAEPHTKPYTKSISGKTIITLSENATADNPALVMTENAMGLSEYLYQILKDVTVLDSENWTPQPDPQKVMEMLNWNKDSEETFDVKLDNLVFNKADKTINFVSDNKAKDQYDDYIKAVGFEYNFSAWNRMKKLIEEKNQDAIDKSTNDGTANPEYYLNITNIDSDEWYEKNWVKASSSFDASTGEMKFTFCFDHHNCGDYVKAEVTYTSLKN